MWQFDKTLRTTLMVDGYYYSGCPHCGKEQFILGDSHERTDEFRMVNINEVRKEKNCYQRK